MSAKMTIFIIILGMILILTGMVSGLKILKPIQLNLIAAITAGLVTLVGFFGKYLYEANSSERNARIEATVKELQRQNEGLKADIATRDSEIIQLHKNLLVKSEELNKFLGGSDAYPILLVSSMKSDKGTPGFTFTIQNEFEYPIYDVEIVAFDFQFIIDKSNNINGEYIVSKDNFDKSIIFGNEQNNIAPNSNVTTFNTYHIPNGILYVKLKCRGNFVFEKIAFVTIEDKIAHGFMVYDEKGKILKSWYGQNPSVDTKQKLDEKFNLIPKSVKITRTN